MALPLSWVTSGVDAPLSQLAGCTTCGLLAIILVRGRCGSGMDRLSGRTAAAAFGYCRSCPAHLLPGDWRTPLIGDPGPCFADLLRLPGMI